MSITVDQARLLSLIHVVIEHIQKAIETEQKELADYHLDKALYILGADRNRQGFRCDVCQMLHCNCICPPMHTLEKPYGNWL